MQNAVATANGAYAQSTSQFANCPYNSVGTFEHDFQAYKSEYERCFPIFSKTMQTMCQLRGIWESQYQMHTNIAKLRLSISNTKKEQDCENINNMLSRFEKITQTAFNYLQRLQTVKTYLRNNISQDTRCTDWANSLDDMHTAMTAAHIVMTARLGQAQKWGQSLQSKIKEAQPLSYYERLPFVGPQKISGFKTADFINLSPEDPVPQHFMSEDFEDPKTWIENRHLQKTNDEDGKEDSYDQQITASPVALSVFSSSSSSSSSASSSSAYTQLVDDATPDQTEPGDLSSTTTLAPPSASLPNEEYTEFVSAPPLASSSSSSSSSASASSSSAVLNESSTEPQQETAASAAALPPTVVDRPPPPTTPFPSKANTQQAPNAADKTSGKKNKGPISFGPATATGPK